MLHSRAAKSSLLKQIPLVPTLEHGRRRLQGSDCKKAAKMMHSRHRASSRKTCFHNRVKYLFLKTRGGREEPQTPVENKRMGGDCKGAPIATSSSFQPKALACGPSSSERAGHAPSGDAVSPKRTDWCNSAETLRSPIGMPQPQRGAPEHWEPLTSSRMQIFSNT